MDQIDRMELTLEPSQNIDISQQVGINFHNHEQKEITETIEPLSGAGNPPNDVHTDTDARAKRFHELVDRDFLGILTSEEEQELEILTRWRDEVKSAFYQNIVTE